MMDRKPYMDVFLRDDNATWVVKDLLPSNQKLVHVTHDECTYFANDGKSKLWLLDGTEEPTLLPKGSGATIIVSEFQCPCHGTMALPSDPSKTSRELFLAGKGRDGWWTAADMNRQFKSLRNYIPTAKVFFFLTIAPTIKRTVQTHYLLAT